MAPKPKPKANKTALRNKAKKKTGGGAPAAGKQKQQATIPGWTDRLNVDAALYKKSMAKTAKEAITDLLKKKLNKGDVTKLKKYNFTTATKFFDDNKALFKKLAEDTKKSVKVDTDREVLKVIAVVMRSENYFKVDADAAPPVGGKGETSSDDDGGENGGADEPNTDVEEELVPPPSKTLQQVYEKMGKVMEKEQHSADAFSGRVSTVQSTFSDNEEASTLLNEKPHLILTLSSMNSDLENGLSFLSKDLVTAHAKNKKNKNKPAPRAYKISDISDFDDCVKELTAVTGDWSKKNNNSSKKISTSSGMFAHVASEYRDNLAAQFAKAEAAANEPIKVRAVPSQPFYSVLDASSRQELLKQFLKRVPDDRSLLPLFARGPIEMSDLLIGARSGLELCTYAEPAKNTEHSSIEMKENAQSLASAGDNLCVLVGDIGLKEVEGSAALGYCVVLGYARTILDIVIEHVRTDVNRGYKISEDLRNALPDIPRDWRGCVARYFSYVILQMEDTLEKQKQDAAEYFAKWKNLNGMYRYELVMTLRAHLGPKGDLVEMMLVGAAAFGRVLLRAARSSAFAGLDNLLYFFQRSYPILDRYAKRQTINHVASKGDTTALRAYGVDSDFEAPKSRDGEKINSLFKIINNDKNFEGLDTFGSATPSKKRSQALTSWISSKSAAAADSSNSDNDDEDTSHSQRKSKRRPPLKPGGKQGGNRNAGARRDRNGRPSSTDKSKTGLGTVDLKHLAENDHMKSFPKLVRIHKNGECVIHGNQGHSTAACSNYGRLSKEVCEFLNGKYPWFPKKN